MARSFWLLSRRFWIYILIGLVVLGDAAFYFLWHPQIDYFAIITIQFALVTLVLELTLHRASNKILSAATTRYLAQWPGHLVDLSNLISGTRADDEILILVDFLGYGHFSNPIAFKAYFKALKDAIERGSRVRILLCAEADARACTEIQFESEFKPTGASDSRDFQVRARDSERFSKWLDHYSNVLHGYRPANFENFIDTLMYLNDFFCYQLLALREHVTIRTMPLRLEVATDLKADPKIGLTRNSATDSWMTGVIYSWIARDREMIFSFPMFYGPKSGHSFQTHDTRLIESFQKQFEKTWDEKTTPVKEHVYRNIFEKMSPAIEPGTSAIAHSLTH
jgi:hypothetical protein